MCKSVSLFQLHVTKFSRYSIPKILKKREYNHTDCTRGQSELGTNHWGNLALSLCVTRQIGDVVHRNDT